MRPFSDILAELSGGATFEECGEQLAELVRAVRDSRKFGTFTLALKVEPNGDDAVKITDKITIKKPDGERGASLFFTTTDGDLLRRDPRQKDLPLTSVSREARV